MLALEMAGFWLNGNWVSVTFVVTPVIVGAAILAPAKPQYKSWNVSAADGDTFMTFNHGFVTQAGVAIAPDDVRLSAPIPSVANSALANWGVNVTATQIQLTKQGAVGSGGTPAIKVIAELPHTDIQ